MTFVDGDDLPPERGVRGTHAGCCMVERPYEAIVRKRGRCEDCL